MYKQFQNILYMLIKLEKGWYHLYKREPMNKMGAYIISIISIKLDGIFIFPG